MVGHDVDDHFDAACVGARHELLGVMKRAVQRINRAVVGDVVAAILARAAVERAQPHGVDTQLADVVQALYRTAEVTIAVAVGVGEGFDVNLIDDGAAPPCVGVEQEGRGRGGGGGLGHEQLNEEETEKAACSRLMRALRLFARGHTRLKPETMHAADGGGDAGGGGR